MQENSYFCISIFKTDQMDTNNKILPPTSISSAAAVECEFQWQRSESFLLIRDQRGR